VGTIAQIPASSLVHAKPAALAGFFSTLAPSRAIWPQDSVLLGKRVIAQFAQPRASSDAAAVMLKARDPRLGLIDRLRA